MAIATNDAKHIFLAALDRATPTERAAYVENACAGDAGLRQRVDALLRAHDEPGAFLSEAKPDPSATTTQAGPSKLVGTVIVGRYKLIEQIGDGGMGTVWMAEQREPVKRLVAVKLIKPGMDSSAVLARFEAERQAIALMDHPNIAKVLDGGTTDDGRPYFVMELVKGLPLTEYCDARRLSVNDRLNLFIQICAAVQHAHQKAVIHRDLKPSNVLVTEHDGKPVPKVIDFGLAKALNASNMLTDRTLHTAYGTVVGTPLYMAPEQVGINAMDVDTRTDIYSLGVILYELLAGSTPLEKARFKEAAWEEVKRLIRDEEPPKPSTRLSGSVGLPSLAASRQTEPAQLSRLVRGELDWIVMKALEKDRSRRYETANGFAMDVQRFLAGEPVQAVPPSVSYRFRKFVRKHRAPVAVAGLVGMALLGGIAGTTWGLIRAEHGRREAQQARAAEAERAESERLARQQAVQSEERARFNEQEAVKSEELAQKTAYAAKMALAGFDWQSGNVGRIRDALAETEKYPDRGFEWYYWQRMCRLESVTYRGHTWRVNTVAFSPDGKRIASGTEYGRIGDAIRVFDADTGRELMEMRGHNAGVNAIAYSPDGKRIASGSYDGTVKIWDADTGRMLGECNPGDWVWAVVFSPDGKRVASRAQKGTSVQIWDVETCRELHKFDGDWNTESVAFSRDGRHIVTGTRQGGLVVWDVETERPVGPSFVSFPDAKGKEDDRSRRYWVNAVAYSSDGQQILGKMGGRLIVWDAKSGGILQNFHQVKEEFSGLAISPDGKSIAGATDRIVKVWDLQTGIEQFSFKGHEQRITSVDFSPDPKRSRIVTGSEDGTAKVWDLDPDRELLTRSDQGRDPRNGIHSVDHSREGGLFVSASWETVKVWRSDNLSLLSTVERDNQSKAAISPDGTRFATPRSVWNAKTGEKIHDLDDQADEFAPCAFSPDGRFLATAKKNQVRVWNAETYQELAPLIGHTNVVHAIACSPDGRRVATASKDRSIRIWDTETGRELLAIKGKIWEWSRTVAFSPDGGRIVSGADDDFAPRVYDAQTGEELLALRGHASWITSVAFSPDGRRIASAGHDGMVKLWDADTGRELLSIELGSSAAVMCLAFSPDGRRIIGGRQNDAVSVWKAADPAELSVWQEAERKANLLREERRVTFETLRAKDPGAIKQWLVLAPIAFDHEGMDPVAALDQQPLPNEAGLQPRADQCVAVGKSELAWKAVRQDNSRLNFNELLGNETEHSVAYAVAYIHSETAQSNLMMRIGSDDQAKIFINEKEVFRNLIGRGYIPDQDTVTGIELKAGLNVLVFKVVNGISDWAGSVWITDAKGQPVQGITVSLEPDGNE